MKEVCIYKLKKAKYPSAPYSPSENYPEFAKFAVDVFRDGENEIYKSVRNLLYQLGYDREHFGTEQWNPFGNLIKKGQKVFLKPNLVFHKHPMGEEAVKSMITNASILRPIIDYILLATHGDVEIRIGDAPIQGGDFAEACRISGMTQLQKFYRQKGIQIELIDMRMVKSVANRMEVAAKKVQLRGKELYCLVDLKEQSELIDKIDLAKRFEITDYGIGAVSKHHNCYKNEYYIPKEVLDSDLFINIPKLKTHRKAGMTCALKNLVGINGDKTCLAHHTRGTYNNGGDEFSKGTVKTWLRVRIWTFLKTNWLGIQVASAIKYLFQHTVWKGKTMKEHNMSHKPEEFSEGSWHGNDTIWRCVKDINKILFYSDKAGMMKKEKQRKYLCFVDAVLAGEGEGPMEQTTKPFGVVMAGDNPVFIDYAATKLMRYNYDDIPCIKNGFINKWWDLVDGQPEEVILKINQPLNLVSQYFMPTFGWEEKLKQFTAETDNTEIYKEL